MALLTALGATPQGLFAPYRLAGRLPDPPRDYPEVGEVLAAAEPRMEEVLEAIDGLAGALAGFDGPPPAPRWNQNWFARTDGAAAYALTRTQPPRRIVEVGSGHSTRFLARALADAGARAEHVCIDPAPRAALGGLPVSWREEMLDEAHLPLFDALEAGDIAFFDSSHVMGPGTDVDLIVNRVLPRLRPGVRVHVHDIFLPWPYPRDWGWRGYGEQNALAPWLLSGAFRPIFSSVWAVARMDAARRPGLADLPWTGAPETSLWLTRE
ncbi:MAG: class I SAM-dependent methyltransferase [Pseudomonadota bacterium]